MKIITATGKELLDQVNFAIDRHIRYLYDCIKVATSDKSNLSFQNKERLKNDLYVLKSSSLFFLTELVLDIKFSSNCDTFSLTNHKAQIDLLIMLSMDKKNVINYVEDFDPEQGELTTFLFHVRPENVMDWFDTNAARIANVLSELDKFRQTKED